MTIFTHLGDSPINSPSKSIFLYVSYLSDKTKCRKFLKITSRFEKIALNQIINYRFMYNLKSTDPI